MKPEENYKRKSSRAPLFSEILYNSEGYVFKAKAINISVGGLLIRDLPHIPNSELVDIMVELPDYFDFQKIKTSTLKALKREDLDGQTFRAKFKIVRSFEGMSEVDKIFEEYIGCGFSIVEEDGRDKILNYINKYKRNVVYLLHLFEHKSDDSLTRIRQICRIFGYPYQESVSILRQKILHDYQSLESA